MGKRFFFTCYFSIILVGSSFAQVNVRDSTIKAPMIIPNVGWCIPSADMAKRFGQFTTVGFDFLYKNPKSWLFGANAHFLFGSKVKETNMLEGILTAGDFLIGADGTLYDVRYQLRGFNGDLRLGKLLPIWGPNKNSGPFFSLGLGFIQHKIRIEYQRNADIPQISKEYLKGYDRLSNGAYAIPALGYCYLSNNRRINFFAQIEYLIAQTQNRRSFNYDQNVGDLSKRNDGILAIKVGWIIPLYERKPDEYYFY
jgi:hypothetical protein